MMSLKRKTISGFKWLSMNHILQKVISVCTFAVLARILEPSTFGLFAMAFIAVDGLSLFKTFGLDGGIIQKKEVSQAANDTAFVLIFSMSATLSVLCFLIAPWVGRFFNHSELVSIVRALGVVFILGGFGRVPSAVLTRQLRFRLISVIDLSGSTANSIFAVIFAFLWPNIWSLVGAYFVKHTLVAVLSWYFSGYRFKWHFDFKHARELFSFGKFLIALSVVAYIGSNVSNLVIGKIMGAASVGFYTLAVNIGNVVNNNFTHIISRVMFPAYSQIQDDLESVTRAYLKTIKFILMISLPFSIALICLSEEFVLTLYGIKWISIVPLIRILGVIQMLAPIVHASGSLYRGCGRPDYDFNLNLVFLAINIPIMVLFTMWWGLTGTVVASLVTILVDAPVSIFLVNRLTGLKLSDFLKQLGPAAFCSAIMFLSISSVKIVLKTYMSSNSIGLFPWFVLIVLSAVGALTYAVAFYFVDRKTTIEVKSMILNLERA